MYGKTINSSFLATACSNIFCENRLFKNILIHLSTKLVGKKFFFNTHLLYNLTLHETKKLLKNFEKLM